jgi:hypothetical protein
MTCHHQCLILFGMITTSATSFLPVIPREYQRKQFVFKNSAGALRWVMPLDWGIHHGSASGNFLCLEHRTPQVLP